jgi:hypothetical protein
MEINEPFVRGVLKKGEIKNQSLVQQSLRMNLLFNSEFLRFETFRNWESEKVHPPELAKAGFIYFNQDDKVQCVCCMEIIGDWEKITNEPLEEHRKRSPNCTFCIFG